MVQNSVILDGGAGGLPFEEVNSFAELREFCIQNEYRSGVVLIQNVTIPYVTVHVNQLSRTNIQLTDNSIDQDGFNSVYVFNYTTGSLVVDLNGTNDYFADGWSARYFTIPTGGGLDVAPFVTLTEVA